MDHSNARIGFIGFGSMADAFRNNAFTKNLKNVYIQERIKIMYTKSEWIICI